MNRVFNNYVVGGNLLKAQQISDDRVMFTHEIRDYNLAIHDNIVSILPNGKPKIRNGADIESTESDFLIPGEVGLIKIPEYTPGLKIKKKINASGNYLYFYNFKLGKWMKLPLNHEVYNRIRTNLGEIEKILSIDNKTDNLKF